MTVDHYVKIIGLIDSILKTEWANEINWASIEHNDPKFKELLDNLSVDLREYKDKFEKMSLERSSSK